MKKDRRIIASQGKSEMLFFHLFFLQKKRTDIEEWNVFSLWQNILAVLGIVIKLRYNAFRDVYEIVLVESRVWVRCKTVIQYVAGFLL